MTAQSTASPLALDGVVKHYPGFTLQLSLDVPRGFVMGLVGANGSGKTTTIKTALGLVRPDAGQTRLVDKTRLGVVLDTPAYNPTWTVTQTGRLLSGFYPSWDAQRFAALTQSWGVPGNRKVKELSRGMGMKLQLAVALSHSAELLILDEPTSRLDPAARDEVLDVLSEFMTADDHSILFSSHITADMARLADYVTILDAGRVIASDTTDDLLAAYSLAAGGPDELTPQVRAVAHGLRSHNTGWDALIPADAALALPTGVQLETPTIDDLAVRLPKGPDHD